VSCLLRYEPSSLLLNALSVISDSVDGDSYYPIICGMQQTLLALAERIKALRKKAGFSQEGFADHCGLHRTQMSILERGKRNPSLGTLQAVADGMDISLSDLLKGVDAAHRKQRKR
jgi:DNA-binding XRE family transcriptional regulator